MKKILFYVILVCLAIMGSMLILDVFVSGLRIMMFGAKLVAIPLAVASIIYVLFSLRRK